MNKSILLKRRPVGTPTINDFTFSEIATPSIGEGEVLLKTLYVSVDPYLRGRMSDLPSYIPPFKVGEAIQSGIIAEVIESNNEKYAVGDNVFGILDWSLYQKHPGKGIKKVDGNKLPLSTYLGVMGLTGLTAYVGLTQIGKPKTGETVVVSGASGAVGSTVGQIAKILGCRTVGICGSDEKAAMLKEKFHFDEAINYKTCGDMRKAIKTSCPKGVDIYFDNVGGEVSDAVHANLNQFARVAVCGAISNYNDTENVTGPRVEYMLIKKSITMQGFICNDFSDVFREALTNLGQWLQDGKLTYTETIIDGFDNIPNAFLGLFDGSNKGKMLVKV